MGMETLNSSLLISFLLFLLTLLTFSPFVSCRGIHHDHLIECLQSQNSDSISQYIFTAENSSYASILQAPQYNLRPSASSSSKPRIILAPVDEYQIQAAIFCAKKHGILIRVRSGGHDYEGLSYISQVPFIMVDLRNLRLVSVDKESKTATIQAGATLGELYYKIAEESSTLAFVAGSCPTVGVGGHFSGGGFSMMSRKFGIAADHIIDAKIIDVNGRILDRQSMGRDLFWAIRGGGAASFGIITEWKVNLVTVPERVTVFNVSRTLEQNASQLVHKWQYIADKIDENLLIRLFLITSISPETQKKTILVSFTSLFIGQVDDLLPLMDQNFPELGLVKEDCQEMSWVDSVQYLAFLPIGKPYALLNRTPISRVYYKGKSDFVKEPISEEGLEGMWQMMLENDVLLPELEFSPYGGRLDNFSESSIPFPHRAGNIYMIHYVAAWFEDDKVQSRRYINWTRRFYSYLAKYVSKSPRAAFLNYRDLDLGVNDEGNTSYERGSFWGVKYFKNNFKRLVFVKTQVDPSNFFRNEQSIPPLVFEKK